MNKTILIVDDAVFMRMKLKKDHRSIWLSDHRSKRWITGI